MIQEQLIKTLIITYQKRTITIVLCHTIVTVLLALHSYWPSPWPVNWFLHNSSLTRCTHKICSFQWHFKTHPSSQLKYRFVNKKHLSESSVTISFALVISSKSMLHRRWTAAKGDILLDRSLGCSTLGMKWRCLTYTFGCMPVLSWSLLRV